MHSNDLFPPEFKSALLTPNPLHRQNLPFEQKIIVILIRKKIIHLFMFTDKIILSIIRVSFWSNISCFDFFIVHMGTKNLLILAVLPHLNEIFFQLLFCSFVLLQISYIIRMNSRKEEIFYVNFFICDIIFTITDDFK